MMQAVTQDDMRAGHAIQDSLGVTVALPFVGLIVTEGAKLVAAVIYNNYDKINIDLSITTFAPLRISALREIARFAFVTNGVKRISCMTLATNHRAVNRLIQMGFEFEGTLRKRFPQGDAFLFCLHADSQNLVRLPEREHARPTEPGNDSCGPDSKQ
jgi:hypothetical protein